MYKERNMGKRWERNVEKNKETMSNPRAWARALYALQTDEDRKEEPLTTPFMREGLVGLAGRRRKRLHDVT
jgi:hypothetical protein